jgi:hypothetical protein
MASCPDDLKLAAESIAATQDAATLGPKAASVVALVRHLP